jgi:hypothetical protein
MAYALVREEDSAPRVCLSYESWASNPKLEVANPVADVLVMVVYVSHAS